MKRSMKAIQQGFTLIELVVVLVIIGILAAIAVPRYLDLADSANTAAFQATAGAIQSASAINFASWAANGNTTNGGAINLNTLGTCQDIFNGLVTGGALPTGYSAVTGATPAVASGTLDNGSDATCTLDGPNNQSTAVHIIYSS